LEFFLVILRDSTNYEEISIINPAIAQTKTQNEIQTPNKWRRNTIGIGNSSSFGCIEMP